jgi:hypothetical protein
VARFELAPDGLIMALGEGALPAALSLPEGVVNPGPRDPHAVRAAALPHVVTPWTRFLEDVTRRGFGEERALSMRSALFRAKSASIRWRASFSAAPAELPPASTSDEAPSGDSFPPPRLRPVGARVLPGEGLWVPSSAAFPSPPGPAEAPPLFFETVVRPDPRSGRDAVRLVVMDGRRLELRPLPGTAAPRSETGLHGDGRIPEADTRRAVAVFAGGSPVGAPDAGVVIDRRPLVFPREGAPTLAVTRLGRSLLGPWRHGEVLPEGITSIRQASSYLLEGGRVVASAEADAWLVDRSALCMTEAGHLIYAWGADIPASTLANALLLAGCADAIPLATGPDPVGFGFVGFTDGGASAQGGGGGAPSTRLLAYGMSFSPEEALSGSPTELMYVVTRDAFPDAPLPEGASWEPDAEMRPSPAWLPAAHAATVTKLGAQVRLLLFAPGRFVFRARSGSKELSHRFDGTFPQALDEQDQARVSAAIGLGVARRKAVRGLALGGSLGLRFGPGSGVLVLDGERARIEKSEGWSPAPSEDGIELPLTADEGHPIAESRVVGTMRARAALCVRADGAVAVASTTFDTDEPTTEALVDLGCARVVALDRGSHQGAFVQRAGTDTPPERSYEQTVLYAIGAPMHGRAGHLAPP